MTHTGRRPMGGAMGLWLVVESGKSPQAVLAETADQAISRLGRWRERWGQSVEVEAAATPLPALPTGTDVIYQDRWGNVSRAPWNASPEMPGPKGLQQDSKAD